MICGVPVQQGFYLTVCAMPEGHVQPWHLDASDHCVWCDRLVTPDGRGDFSPARTEGGVLVHRGCLFALDAERLGVRRVAGEAWRAHVTEATEAAA